MNNQKRMLHRLLRLAVPLLLVLIILLWGAGVERTPLGPDTDSFYVRARITDVQVDHDL